MILLIPRYLRKHYRFLYRVLRICLIENNLKKLGSQKDARLVSSRGKTIGREQGERGYQFCRIRIGLHISPESDSLANFNSTVTSCEEKPMRFPPVYTRFSKRQTRKEREKKKNEEEEKFEVN